MKKSEIIKKVAELFSVDTTELKFEIVVAESGDRYEVVELVIEQPIVKIDENGEQIEEIVEGSIILEGGVEIVAEEGIIIEIKEVEEVPADEVVEEEVPADVVEEEVEVEAESKDKDKEEEEEEDEKKSKYEAELEEVRAELEELKSILGLFNSLKEEFNSVKLELSELKSSPQTEPVVVKKTIKEEREDKKKIEHERMLKFAKRRNK